MPFPTPNSQKFSGGEGCPLTPLHLCGYCKPVTKNPKSAPEYHHKKSNIPHQLHPTLLLLLSVQNDWCSVAIIDLVEIFHSFFQACFSQAELCNTMFHCQEKMRQEVFALALLYHHSVCQGTSKMSAPDKKDFLHSKLKHLQTPQK